jgi:hypothetical protein
LRVGEGDVQAAALGALAGDGDVEFAAALGGGATLVR